MSGHPVFAWCFEHVITRAERRDGSWERRRDAVSTATGRVLELGAGTGLNLPHYDPERVAEVFAVEPDPHMLRRLIRAAPRAHVPVRVAGAAAESLPVPDRWADTVVVWLVLCSVEDPGRVAREIRRVLAPEGRALVYEHVRAEEGPLSSWQRRCRRPWGWIAGGCDPSRDTAGTLEAEGLTWDELRRFDVPGSALARPHIQGVARAAR